MGIGLPSLVEYLIVKRSIQTAAATNLLGAFGFFFMIFAVFLPLYISSYSLVGEKIEKSIEPLLSTPTSDGEILIGKYIGVFIPSILSIYLGSIIFMILVDLFTFGKFGYLFFPNVSFGIILLIAVPLASLYAISFSVFVSSKVNNAQTAYQLGVMSVIPFIILYVMGEIGIVSLNNDTNVLIISGAVLIMSILMYIVSRATFRRDEILTSWK
jgi:ABC-2 type transport system permease protein